MPRDTLGEFEQLVLLACLRTEPHAYAVSVLEQIEARTGRRPTHAAVYVALRRLEKRRLVRSRLGPPTAQRGGRAKRYFEVRTEAVRRLKASREDLMRMWEGLETA